MPDFSFLASATFWKYASMPVISAIIGYVTNRLAIHMMFHPIEFVGVLKPLCGWQGIIPRKAAKMASIATDKITGNLIDSREIFGRLEPRRVAELLAEPLQDLSTGIVEDIMANHHAEVWSRMPAAGRRAVIERVQASIPGAIEDVVRDMRDNVDQIFDIKNMVVTTLVYNKALLNQIFLQAGDQEFKFIGRSGVYFGFPLGVIQMLIWVVYQPFWLLPLAGMFVGWFTNWMALKMIFNPRQKHRIAGIEWHGLFFKRQNDVAKAYADLIAKRVLAPGAMLRQVLKGPYSDRIFDIFAQRVGEAVDASAGAARPVFNLAVGEADYIRMKETAVNRVFAATPADIDANPSPKTRQFINYADETMGIEQTLTQRMSQLSPPEFEGMLRPAFEEDEWILIAVGATLGFAVGVFQFMVLFGGG